MFRIPNKKIRGVEKNTFVVLNKTCRACADKPDTSAKGGEFSRFNNNKFTELMFVINGDALRNGEFAEVIPVVFDADDRNQWKNIRYRIRKKRILLYRKSQLEPILGNPKDYFDEIMVDGSRWNTLTQIFNLINQHYKVEFEKRKIEPLSLARWEHN